MKKIELGTSEGTSFISELKECDLVILAGSVISSWEPTCLFSGRQFTDEMFKILFPPTFVDSDSIERNILEELFKRVPFEHLLERYPNRDKLASVLSRAFSIENFNPIHKVLAKALIDSRIKALITTNYDLCLDKVLSCYQDHEYLLIIAKDDIKNDIKNKKLYFKIHGSADDSPGGCLVFVLTHESILPRWKRKILWKILNQRILIIVGYSGSDFEICPDIERIPLKQIVWNTYSEEFPSKNAERILGQKDGVQLIGDMKILLSDLFEEKIDTVFNPKSEVLDFVKLQFAEIEIMEWRASLLNSIGFPSLALKASEEFLYSISSEMCIDYIRGMRQKAQALFHLGKYRDSSSLFHKASLKANKINKEYLEADLLLDASSSLRSYGALFRSRSYTKIAWKIAMNMKNKGNRDRLLAKVFLRKVLLLRYFQQVAKAVKFQFLTQWINKKAKESLLQTASLSLKSGNWFDFYQTRLLSDRMSIPIGISVSNNYYEPPTTKDAYIQLGYYIPLSIHTREQLEQNNGPLTENDERNLCFHLERGKITMSFPEIWKITWLGIKREKKWRINKETWRDFFHSFFSCQYTIGMRFFKLIFGE